VRAQQQQCHYSVLHAIFCCILLIELLCFHCCCCCCSKLHPDFGEDLLQRQPASSSGVRLPAVLRLSCKVDLLDQVSHCIYQDFYLLGSQLFEFPVTAVL
jgi:hypothetical protein